MYNQYLQRETVMACSIISLLHIILYRYWITVYNNFIVKLAIFFDKLWKFNMVRGAVFKVIDKAFVVSLNWKLDLKFKIEENLITEIDKTDKKTYQLWIKNYSTYKFRKALELWDWRLTKEWVDYMMQFSWGSGHALNFDLSGGWYIIDTDWSKACKMSLAVLKYWEKKWLFWNTIRTISPNNEETEAVCNLCIRLFRAEKNGTLEAYLRINKWKPYLDKAKKLFYYWR